MSAILTSDERWGVIFELQVGIEKSTSPAKRTQQLQELFEIDLTVNAQDVEETVWRYLCVARSLGVEEARNSLLTVKKGMKNSGSKSNSPGNEESPF